MKSIAINGATVGGLIIGTLIFMRVFTATFEASVKSIPEGSLASLRGNSIQPSIQPSTRERPQEFGIGDDHRVVESEDEPDERSARPQVRIPAPREHRGMTMLPRSDEVVNTAPHGDGGSVVSPFSPESSAH